MGVLGQSGDAETTVCSWRQYYGVTHCYHVRIREQREMTIRHADADAAASP